MSQTEISVLFKVEDSINESEYKLELAIYRNGEHKLSQLGHLVIPPSILEQYERWLKLYNPSGSRISEISAQVTNVGGNNPEALLSLGCSLQKDLAKCYREGISRKISDLLLQELGGMDAAESIQIVVQVPDNHPRLRRLPWQLFFHELLDKYPRAEVSLANTHFISGPPPKAPTDRIRILKILGHDKNIDVSADSQLLKRLVPEDQAEIISLIKPSAFTVFEKIQAGQFDILFFAGHGEDEDGEGKIWLNSTECISLSKLKSALRTAISKGLRLAIFNSCDGLGLAEDLAELSIPYVIVMRDIILDTAAQDFLRQFLTYFTTGDSLHQSVRQARQGLKVNDKKYPFASWLPVIFQSPVARSLYWHDIVQQPHTSINSKAQQPRKTYINLPRTKVTRQHFYGRDHDLQNLHTLLTNHDLVAIVGMGGLGKSELAMHYANEQISHYAGGICYLDAQSGNIGQQLVDFAHSNFGNMPDFKVPEDVDLSVQVNYCWRNWPNGQVLLIFDDVNDQTLQVVNVYLPPDRDKFRVLLTTRTKHILPRIKDLELDVLSAEQSLEILRLLVGDERIEQELDTAEAICKWLSHIPLALELLGRYLAERTTISLVTMLERLKQKGIKHNSTNEFVAKVLDETWSELKSETQALACLLGLFAQAPLPWLLVESVAKIWQGEIFDDEKLEDALAQLLKFSLLHESDKGIYRIHPLVREFFRAKLADFKYADNQKQAFCKAIGEICRKVDPTKAITVQLKSALKLDINLDHIAEVASYLSDSIEDGDLFHIFYALGAVAFSEGLRKDGERWYRENLRLCEMRLPAQSIHLAMSKRNLADVIGIDKNEAIKLAREAYKSQYKLSPIENQIEATKCLSVLGSLFRSLKQYRKTRLLHHFVLKERIHLLGEDDLLTLQAKHNYAFIINLQGHHQDAMELYNQVLAAKRKVDGNDHCSLAITLSNLGVELIGIGIDQGSLENLLKAKEQLEEALEIDQTFRGPDHKTVALRKVNLAATYRELAKLSDDHRHLFAEAERFLEESRRIRLRVFGDKSSMVFDSDFGLSKLYLAMSYHDESKLDKALDLCAKVLKSRENNSSEEHPKLNVATSRNTLGEIYIRLFECGKRDKPILEEAVQLFSSALKIRRNISGGEHRLTKRVAKNLEKVQHLIEEHKA
jgi:tetratricopeptide (TPR) repeat protein